MPEVTITIGSRPFSVSCQEGEEHFLHSAAKILDTEAGPLVASMGRLPEARMLLMSGLMLADRTASVEDENRALKAKLAALEARPIAEREIPTIPNEVVETLAELAARAESIAATVEERWG
jgi:cell division protein ZapA